MSKFYPFKQTREVWDIWIETNWLVNILRRWQYVSSKDVSTIFTQDQGIVYEQKKIHIPLLYCKIIDQLVICLITTSSNIRVCSSINLIHVQFINGNQIEKWNHHCFILILRWLSHLWCKVAICWFLPVKCIIQI